MSPTKEEYSNLCLLLTLNKLTDHPDYKVRNEEHRFRNDSFFSQNWNPIKARAACFQQILPLVKDLLTGEKKEAVSGSILAANDRLLQLIIKGLQ